MIFNIVSGGAKFATISVTFPEGATVTCTQSPFEYTVSSGTSHTFTVPKSGTWTLTATKNSMTATETVDATTYGAAYEVSLVLRNYLFKAGEGAKVGLTPHTERYHTAAGYAPDVTSTANYNTDRIYIRGATGVVSETESHDVAGYVDTDSVDLTNFDKLCIDSLAYNSYVLYIRKNNSNVTTRTITTTTRGLTQIDISSLSGNHVVRVYANGYSHSGTVYNAYLEVS